MNLHLNKKWTLSATSVIFLYYGYYLTNLDIASFSAAVILSAAAIICCNSSCALEKDTKNKNYYDKKNTVSSALT